MKPRNYPQQNPTVNLQAVWVTRLWQRFPWRPNYYSSITVFTLILSLCFSTIPTSVLSAAPANDSLTSPASSIIPQRINLTAASFTENQNQQQSEIKEHVLKFYLQPTLVPDLDFAKAVLPKYVEDMNTILAKNTSCRLVFNPETDIILTVAQPHSNQATLPLPVENFEIWAYAVQSNYQFSYGGYAGVDWSGAGVLAGLKWTRLYDPDELTPAQLMDYWTQINNMLHEFAHVFGAGIGEYYKLSSIQDATGVAPLLNINVLDPDDLFWSDKRDFMADPLLRNAAQEGISSREGLLDFVKYSALTATIISGNYRNSVPTIDLQNITVSVVTDDGAPISDANIKIWSVVGNTPYQTKLVVDAFTDSNGQISFAWGGSSNPHNNYDFLRLIKVYKDGYIFSAKYVSIYDADIVKLVNGNSLYNIPISLNEASTPPILTSIVCASPNPTIATNVDFTVKFSEPVTGVDASDFIVTKTGAADATVSNVSGSNAIYTVTVSSASSGTINLDVVDNDTIVGLGSNPLGGVGENKVIFTSSETCTINNVYSTFLPIILSNFQQ
jgi:hypothetical protein